MRLSVVLVLLSLTLGIALGRASVAFQAIPAETTLLTPKLEPGCWYHRESVDVVVSCPTAVASGDVSDIPLCALSCTAAGLQRFEVRSYRYREQGSSVWAPVVLLDGGVDFAAAQVLRRLLTPPAPTP